MGATANTNHYPEPKRDLSLTARILEYQDQLENDDRNDQSNESTRLLWKPNGLAAEREQIPTDQGDVEAGREQEEQSRGWLARASEAVIVFYMTMLDGFLPLMSFWILIAFLVFAFCVTSYPESYIILAVLLCLVPIVLYGNYKIGRAFERGARNS